MYKIVFSRKTHSTDAIEEVEQKVNKLKAQGWIEQGGISISYDSRTSIAFSCTVAQAMVKKNKTKKLLTQLFCLFKKFLRRWRTTTSRPYITLQFLIATKHFIIIFFGYLFKFSLLFHRFNENF